jgi:hypothetical protein
MDKFELSRKMKRLTAWLDTQNQPDGLAGLLDQAGSPTQFRQALLRHA